MRIELTTRLFALMLTLATIAPAAAAEWGSLKGRLIFDDDPGKPAAINVNKDVEYCSKHKLVDETITVGEKEGLTNVVVYLYVKKGKSVAIHPDLKEFGAEPVVLENKGCRFAPHVMMVRTGQKFEIRNSDPGLGHNTNATFFANTAFNETVTNERPLVKVFPKNESLPAPIVCNIHPWMKAYVLVRDNPYMAVTGKDGSFEIKNLPAGKHEFIFWHEAKGFLRGQSVGGTKTSRKGRAKLEISADKTLDLGEVKVSAKMLGK